MKAIYRGHRGRLAISGRKSNHSAPTAVCKRGFHAISLSGLFVSLLLFTVHAAVVTSSAPGDYITQFGANARRIMGGEAYRCVTALLLHADGAHLAGNMVALVLFGDVLCQIAGVGVTWMMILVCGTLGNLINAAFHETGHLSIGASTSVFGAVGMLCAIRAVNAARTGHGWKDVVLALGAASRFWRFWAQVRAVTWGPSVRLPRGDWFGGRVWFLEKQPF